MEVLAGFITRLDTPPSSNRHHPASAIALLHPAGAARRFANTPKGRSDLIAWLTDFTVVRVVFEPTGAYHHAFERQLAEAGLPLAKTNPRQDRRFAEAVGRRAKTPRRLAAMLARFDSLVSIPGVGDTTALIMLVEMPELGTLEHRCAASPAGLAPVARDSGRYARQALHPRRSCPATPGAPHARPRRGALQP